nr:MAG TPA: hypothetical protein [Caudoviricetes sp.]
MTAAPGLFSPSNARPWSSCTRCGCPGLYLYPACPLCVPVRPLADFCAVRGIYTTQGMKPPYGRI